jgi:hypothetical protein
MRYAHMEQPKKEVTMFQQRLALIQVCHIFLYQQRLFDN